MPAASRAQQRWAFGVKGAAWARKHHFDTKGKLPDHSRHAKPQDERARLAEAFRKANRKKKRGKVRGTQA